LNVSTFRSSELTKYKSSLSIFLKAQKKYFEEANNAEVIKQDLLKIATDDLDEKLEKEIGKKEDKLDKSVHKRKLLKNVYVTEFVNEHSNSRRIWCVVKRRSVKCMRI